MCGSPSEPSSPTRVVYIQSPLVPGGAVSMPCEITAGAECGQKYEALESNVYNTLDEASAPAPPPIRFGESFDDCGYLKVRDSKDPSDLESLT